MTEQDLIRPSTSSRVVAALRELRELIAALDRRVPHAERTAEGRIAQDSATLRTQAVTRIRKLLFDSEPHRYDQELVEAIMTDDGGPSPGSESDARA
jgi:hypothetical protein